MATLTGNPDVDITLLFSLPDSALLAFCNSSQLWRNLCFSPRYEERWRERYRQCFSNIPPVGNTWWQSYQRARRLTVEASIRTVAAHYGANVLPCLLVYVAGLAERIASYIHKHTKAETISLLQRYNADYDLAVIDKLTYPREFILSFIDRFYSGLAAVYIRRDVFSPAPTTPWVVNRQLRTYSLIETMVGGLGPTIPLTVVIGNRRGVHSLTEDQFMGMQCYCLYTGHSEVKFYLYTQLASACPANTTIPCLANISRAALQNIYGSSLDYELHNLPEEIPPPSEFLQLTMHNGDHYYFPGKEFMQGFITMARWLGENYRRAYARIVSGE
jgi:hypothetical protein